jgi:hypothetical protein
MAIEMVANNPKPETPFGPMDEIFDCLCQIQSLAQVIQSATEKNGDDKSGLYGTAHVVEMLAERAIKLTGV